MANTRKEDRVQDSDIKRFNHTGLSLKCIADMLGCHPATITLRLNAMGISPTDTRRSFMEQVWNSLDEEQQDWLSHNLYNTGIGVKEFVTALIKREYESNPGTVTATPAEMPELEGGKPADGSSEESKPQVPPELVTDQPEKPPPATGKKKKLKFD